MENDRRQPNFNTVNRQLKSRFHYFDFVQLEELGNECLSSSPVRVDDPYVDNDSVSIANRDIAQCADVEVGRLVIDDVTAQRTVLADPDVTEVEVLTVTSVHRRNTVARVRRVGQISTSGAVEARLA